MKIFFIFLIFFINAYARMPNGVDEGTLAKCISLFSKKTIEVINSTKEVDSQFTGASFDDWGGSYDHAIYILFNGEYYYMNVYDKNAFINVYGDPVYPDDLGSARCKLTGSNALDCYLEKSFYISIYDYGDCSIENSSYVDSVLAERPLRSDLVKLIKKFQFFTQTTK